MVDIHWTCEAPSHYNDFLFRAIHEANVGHLRVHYRHATLSSHPWRLPLRSGYDSRIQSNLFGIDWSLVVLPLRDRQALFLLGGWNSLTAILMLLLCAALRRRYSTWTDTPNEARRRAPVLAFFRRRLLGFGLNRAVAVLGTGTPALASLVRMGVRPNLLINFPFCVDLDAYRRGTNCPANERQIVKFLSAGRVQNEVKGHDIAIRSLATVAREMPEFRFEYAIAGAGPDMDMLQRLADELNIGSRVFFLGWLEPDEVISAMCNFDVLLHPSPELDPYPVAVLEAMAAGMVVLASDLAGSAVDRIQHGVNGLIHRAGEVRELAQHIASLLPPGNTMTSMSRTARHTAEQWPVSRGVAIIRELVVTSPIGISQ